MTTATGSIATRETITKAFNTDDATTHRILMNICWGFFVNFFGSDSQAKWDEAHPFVYPNHPSRDYHSFSVDFIGKHFDLFAGKQFWTGMEWKKNNAGTYNWSYPNGFNDVEPTFN